MADHLVRHPEDIAVLRGQEAGRRPDAKTIREEFLRAVAADPADAEPTAGTAEKNATEDATGKTPRGKTAPGPTPWSDSPPPTTAASCTSPPAT